MNIQKGYEYFSHMKSDYAALYDDISRELYFLRIALDVEMNPSIIYNPDIIRKMVTLSGIKEYFSSFEYDLDSIWNAINNKIPIMIYGAGAYGKRWCEFLSAQHANIRGFYDKNYQNIHSIMGFSVFEPPKNPEGEHLILITPLYFVDEIYESLLQKGFTCNRLLRGCSKWQNDTEHQYFDFLDKYPEGGAFVDAGCFDCDTSFRFSRWCGGKYSKIFAFEPDEKNIQKCKRIANQKGLERIEFYQVGLAKESGTAAFCAMGSAGSYISEESELMQQIILRSLDEIVDDTRVSFIKMDIEGAELSALQGAENTIQRDKPLCAISVYHKPGDMLIIMDYLKSLVPEYKFALRHYSNSSAETVLYAFLE